GAGDVGVGRDGEQPSCAVLLADARGTGAVAGGARGMAAGVARGEPRDAAGRVTDRLTDRHGGFRMRRLRSRLRSEWMRVAGLRARRTNDERADDEFRFHLEMLIARNERSGMTADEARRAAHVQFGG